MVPLLRKKISFILFLSITFGINFQSFSQEKNVAQEIHKRATFFNTNNKIGLKINKQVIIPALFDTILPFNKNYARVKIENSVGLYQFDNKLTIPCKYDSLNLVNDSLVYCYLNDKMGLLSLQNKLLLKPIYKKIIVNAYGNAIVENFKQIILASKFKKDTLYGDSLLERQNFYELHANKIITLINKNCADVTVESKKSYVMNSFSSMGKFKLIKFDTLINENIKKHFCDSVIYKNATKIITWNDSVFIFYNGSKCGLSNVFSTTITENMYDEIIPLNFNYLRFRIGNSWGIMNKKGKRTSDTLFDCIQPYTSHQFCLVTLNNKEGIIGYNGLTIIKPTNNFLKFEKSENIFTISSQNKYLAIIDTNGTQLLDTTYNYQEIGRFNNGFAKVKKFNKYGFINKRGGLTIATQYNKTNDLVVAERTAVLIKNKWALVDCWEKMLAQPHYDSIGYYKDSVVIAIKNKKWQVLDYYGKELCSPKFDKIKTFNTNYFITTSNNKKGVMTKYGNELIFTKYDEIIDLIPEFVLVKNNNHYGIISLSGREIEEVIFDYGYLSNQCKNYILCKNIPRIILKF